MTEIHRTVLLATHFAYMHIISSSSVAVKSAKFSGLGLGLKVQVLDLGFGLECQVLGLGLGLAGQVLVNITGKHYNVFSRMSNNR